MKVGFLPIESAIGDFLFDNDVSENKIDEELLKKWAVDAVKMISTDEQLHHRISLLDVNNYKVELPDGFKILCEVAYRLEPEKNCGTKYQQLTKFAQRTPDGCELEINLKCPKCYKTECEGCGGDSIVVDVDRVWELANSYYNHSTRFMTDSGVKTFGRGEYPSFYSDKFLLLKPASTSWFQLSKQLPDCANVHCQECSQSYMIEHPNIELSFEKGEILLAYLSTPVDSEGNNLVPDHVDAIEAVTSHILHKMCKMEWIKDKSDRAKYLAYKDTKLERDEAVGRARSALQIPSAAELSCFLGNNRKNRVHSAYENYLNGCSPTPTKWDSYDKHRNK